jgi:TonB-dependent Receptor Plug Domain/CarboxypepD_reg-like domain
MKQIFTLSKSLSAAFVLFFLINFESQAQQVILKGEVQDFLTQQAIPGASVKVKRLVKKFVNGEYTNERVDFKGVIVDSSGRFEIKLPKNEYVVEASSIGYIKDSKFINVKSDLTILMTLSGETNNLDEVEIKSQKAEGNVRDVQSSVIKLNMQSLKKLPIVFGEGDIIRALTLQPGVTTVGEGAGGFNVRGGKTDQNLVLIDDAPIFNTSHLLGLFTSVNPEAVQNANLYKGNVPARYGGRLSSLLNITSKTQTSEAKRAIGAGPISANLFFQQPFSKDKGSILLAGRMAYPNLVLKALPRRFRGSKAFFYDLNTAVQFRIHPKHSIKLTGYQSSDDFKFPEDTSYNWNSQAATAQLNSILSDKLSLSVKGILSHYTFGVNGLAKGLEFELASKIRHHEIRADLAYDLKKHKIETGASVIYYRFSPGNQSPTSDSSAVVVRNIADDFGREASAYLSHEWTISKRISLSSGLRFAQFDNIGPNKTFVYEANSPLLRENITDTIQYTKGQKSATYGGIEPRFGVKFELNDHQSIKASYNRTRQFLHLISNTTAISPIDYWKLSGNYIKPQVADQFSLGFYQNFSANNYQTYVEGFYKTMQNQIEYKDGADLILNPHLETELVPASGVAYGVEVSVQKTKGRFTGNVGYTWSRTFIKTNSIYDSEQINNGAYYPSLFDKPHNLSLLGQYFLGKGWTFSSTFVYQTGRPITYPDGQYVYNQDLILNYSKRNADRLPDFHRMDVSLSRDSRKTKNQKKYNIVNISFYNLYARKNPYSIFFRQYLNVNRSYRLAVLGTIVPSLTLTKYW